MVIGWGRATLLAATALLASFGCAPEKTDEEIAQVRSALGLAVSNEFDVERFPTLHPDTSFQNNASVLACGTVRCLATYSQAFNGAGYVYATRIDTSGVLLDMPRLVLDSGSVNSAAALGDDFLLATSRTGARRLRGSDGTLEDVTAKLPANVYALASSGNTWLALHDATGGPKATVLRGADLATVGSSATFPTSLFGGYPIAGVGQYLVANQGWAMRVDEATGQLLDATGIEFSRYRKGWTRGVLRDGIYYLVWETNGDIYTSRIRASDGAVLDLDDHFNQISGANLICQRCGSNPQANLTATEILITWDSAAELQGARLDPSTGERLDGLTTGPELRVGSAGQAPRVHMGATWGIAVDSDRASGGIVTGLQVVSSPFGVSVARQSVLQQRSIDRSQPVVASNRRGFAVVWRANLEIYATQIDPVTKSYLHDPPLQIGRGTEATIAADGTDYLVVWVNEINQLERRFLRANGTLDAPLVPPLAAMETWDNFTASALRLVHNGKYFLLTWLRGVNDSGYINGYRLRADGTALETQFLPLIGPEAPFFPGKFYSIFADTSPPESMRTFLVVASVDGNIRVRRVRSETGAIIEPITTLGRYGRAFTAGDGTNAFVAHYDWEEPAGVVGTFVDPLTGLSSLASPSQLIGGTGLGRVEDAWYDGKSFSLLMVESSDWYARRYDRNLSPQEPAQPVGGTLLAKTFFPIGGSSASVASDGQGRSLFAYLVMDSQRQGISVKAKILDNDGMAIAPPGDAGSSDGGEIDGSGGSADGGLTDASGDGTSDASVDGIASGGAAGTGGASGSAGMPGTGGAGGSAGITGTGGTPASGGAGSGATGGTANAGESGLTGGVGGSVATGGLGGGAGSAPSGSADESGCGCIVPSTASRNSHVASVLIFAIAVGRMRRRARPRRQVARARDE